MRDALLGRVTAAEYAAEHGLGERWTERMFRVFFVEQRDIGDVDVLADVATHLGLDAAGSTLRARVRAVLGGAP